MKIRRKNSPHVALLLRGAAMNSFQLSCSFSQLSRFARAQWRSTNARSSRRLNVSFSQWNNGLVVSLKAATISPNKRRDVQTETWTGWEIQRAEIISCGIGHICKWWMGGNSNAGTRMARLTSSVKCVSGGFQSIPLQLYCYISTQICIFKYTVHAALSPAASSASTSISMWLWAELHAASQTQRRSQWEEAAHSTDRRRSGRSHSARK